MSNDLRDHIIVRSMQEILQQDPADISGFAQAAKVAASRPADVISLLTCCLAQPTLCHGIPGGAYWHSNGFAKFVIYDATDSAFRLRLHIWTGEHSQIRQDDQNVHGHRWNFGSAVIAGSGLHVDEYVVSETGARYRSYAYRSQRNGSADGDEFPVPDAELEHVGEARLERSVSYALGTHDAYVCDISRLHTVRTASADLTATLIVQGPSVLSSAPVYRRLDQQPQLPTKPMTDAQARWVLTATIDAVKRSEAHRDQAR